MNDRNSTEFFDSDFYKEAFLFSRSHIMKNGGSEEEARDVLQDAVERFLNRLNDKDFQLEYQPKQFLYGFIKNIWHEKLRSKKKSPEEEFIHDEHVDTGGNGIQEKLQTEKQIDIFNRCLKLLNPGCIEALKMQKKGIGLEKMTRKLGLKSRGILQDKLYRCQRQLKKLIFEDKDYIALLNDR